ncbi:MAG: hypothetical protein EBU90_03535 [Proteobacteria bacterium]|nr:hypothetical protein [Pseudomonadota bacterium]NBP13398.1 hypothetical protein [bacterium]
MARIEDVILTVSPETKAKLYGPAKKAFEAPDTGVTITKPAAYRVIKDCAETTLLFLPIEIFLKLKSPVQTLKGKVTKDQIVDLYNRASGDSVSKILFQLLLDSCPKSTPQAIPAANILSHVDVDDPYGTYGDNAPVFSEESKSAVELVIATYC